MKAALVIVWIAALAASLWFAVAAWRRSRPFDTFRSYNPFGSDVAQPRAVVWAPAGMLILFGVGMLRAVVVHAGTPPLPFAAFMVAWMALLAAISWMVGRALERSKKKV